LKSEEQKGKAKRRPPVPILKPQSPKPKGSEKGGGVCVCVLGLCMAAAHGPHGVRAE
jgi:hypothetical protein